jgi:hypothetical protein
LKKTNLTPVLLSIYEEEKSEFRILAYASPSLKSRRGPGGEINSGLPNSPSIRETL